MWAASSRVKNLAITPYENWTYNIEKLELAQ